MPLAQEIRPIKIPMKKVRRGVGGGRCQAFLEAPGCWLARGRSER